MKDDCLWEQDVFGDKNGLKLIIYDNDCTTL